MRRDKESTEGFLSTKKKLCKIKYSSEGSISMLILALHLTLHISSTLDFNLVQVLVQALLLQSMPKVTTFLEILEDVMFNVFILIKKKILNSF